MVYIIFIMVKIRVSLQFSVSVRNIAGGWGGIPPPPPPAVGYHRGLGPQLGEFYK